MFDFMYKSWPWYISGPLIGLMVPALLVLANKSFGISSSLRHICAACAPVKSDFFKYDWKSKSWNLFFVAGIILGGTIGSMFMDESRILVSQETAASLLSLGIEDVDGLLPETIFSWESLFSFRGFVFIVVGGFLVGFGSRYAGGCTSGHAIMGLSNLQWPSLVAVIGFFLGGLIATHLLLPVLL